MIIIQTIMLMGILGVGFAVFLGFSDRRFHVKTNLKVGEVDEVLPGVNCGGCGYPSCGAYAEAVAEKGEAIDLCVVGGADTTRAVAHIMGVKVTDEDREKLVAVVFCQGDSEAAGFPGEFHGIPDCSAAVYSQDVAKRCKYGCIGLGSCVRSCPFDAIHMSETGIPYVDAEKCTACGNCVVACPRDLIELHPVNYEAFVFCKSQDTGPIARQVCKRACIACKICVKAAAGDDNPESVSMDGNLAVVNTQNYTAKVEYGAKCPTVSYSSRRNLVNFEAFVSENTDAEAVNADSASEGRKYAAASEDGGRSAGERETRD